MKSNPALTIVAVTASSLLYGCNTAAQMVMEAPRIAVCAASTVVAGVVDEVVSKRPTRRRTTRTRQAPTAARQFPPTVVRQPRPVAPPRVDRIATLYDQFEYDRCLRQIDAVLHHSASSSLQQATAYLHKGVILFLRGQRDEAAECFRQVHRRAPGFAIDTDRFKPAVVTCFEAARP